MKQVIVVRKDLNMRKGKIAAQVAHASMGVLLKDMRKNPIRWLFMIGFYKIMRRWPNTNCFGKWLNGPFKKIVVSVDNLKYLEHMEWEAHDKGIPYCLITDSGATEFKGAPTITCLAIGPEEENKIDDLTRNLQLL